MVLAIIFVVMLIQEELDKLPVLDEDEEETVNKIHCDKCCDGGDKGRGKKGSRRIRWKLWQLNHKDKQALHMCTWNKERTRTKTWARAGGGGLLPACVTGGRGAGGGTGSMLASLKSDHGGPRVMPFQRV